MSEHVTEWLKQSMLLKLPRDHFAGRKLSSSVAKHPSVTRHIVDPILLFEVLLRNPNPKLLALSEAMLIRLRNPTLCSQKILPQSFQLP